MQPAAQRIVDRLFELTTRLPWWAALLLALATYSLLHPIAVLQMPTPVGGVGLAATAFAELFVLLARIGQYLLPGTFLGAAAVSGFANWKRGELRDSVASDTTGSILRGLSWTDFELLVADSFRQRGYEPCASPVDSEASAKTLELARNGQRFLVDCADWRCWKAGAAALRGLHERVKATGAAGGFAVTSGQFTPEAKHFAADKDIELIDGRHLKGLIRAESSPAARNPWHVVHLESILAHGRDWLPTPRRLSSKETRARAPRRHPRGRPTPQNGDGSLRNAAAEDSVAANEEELAVGRELTALIRARNRIEEEIELLAPLVQKRKTEPPRPRLEWPRIRARKIADAVGILVAMGIFWGIYQWFLLLPGEPTDTPWALLGAGGKSEDFLKGMQGFTPSQSSVPIPEGDPPLGHFQFGPAPDFPITTEAEIQMQGGPAEVYHSLRELETAFEARYVPPPECYAYESSTQMVKCGNHRIRARRTFIASGGKVTSTLLGGWEETPPISTEMRPEDWRQDGQVTWQHGSSREWDQGREQDGSQEGGQGLQRGSDQDLSLGSDRRTARDQSDQDLRREWIRRPNQDPGQDPGQDWRRNWPQSTEEDSRGDWISEPPPVERRHWVDDL